MIEVCLGILVVTSLTNLALNGVLLFGVKRMPLGKLTQKVSVLIAARNEEKNIQECLDSVLQQQKLDHPFEILVGDDQSSDSSLELTQRTARIHPTLFVHSITDRLGNAGGKGNVIAHLTRLAKGSIYCITDADMVHSPTWVLALATRLSPRRGICIGVTAVEGSGLGARLQSLDWLLAQGMIKVATICKFPVTALGNNMAISRQAYESTGGLENLPPTLTEDFQLFKFIQRQGYAMDVNFSAEALCFTKPSPSMREWLNQRKRWTYGAIRVHWLPLMLLLANILVLPSLVATSFFNMGYALAFLIGHYLLQGLFLLQIHRILKLPYRWFDYFVFQTLTLGGSFWIAAYCLLPGNVVWKNRKYSFWKV